MRGGSDERGLLSGSRHRKGGSMGAKVAVMKGRDPYKRTLSGLRALGAVDFSGIRSAFIKVNLAPYSQYRSAEVAALPQVACAVAHYLRANGVERISVGEGAVTVRGYEGFRELGYTEMCEREGIALVDLDQDSMVNVAIPDSQSLHEVGLPETLLKQDMLASVAVMRTHRHSITSLCMKNLMGIVMPAEKRWIIHIPFDKRITDLTMYLTPRLSVVDASNALDRDGFKRVKMDLTLSGTDIVAVDAVGTAIMGFDPLRLDYIKLAQNRGLGTGDLNEIEVVGAPIAEVRRKFII